MSNSERNSHALTDLLDSCDATITKLQHLENALKGVTSLLPDLPENSQSRSMLSVLAENISFMWCDIDSNLYAFREADSGSVSHE